MAKGSGNVNPRIRLYSPDGTLVLSATNVFGAGTCVDTSIVEVSADKLAVGGAYTLLASDCGDTNTGSFQIFAQRLNNPGAATPLQFSGQTQTDTISSTAQSNTYTFAAAVNDVIDLTVTRAKGSLNPKIRIYNPDGTLLAYAINNVGAGTCVNEPTVEARTVKIAATGIHTVLVGDCDSTNTGDYTLSSLCFGVCALGPSPLSVNPASFTFNGFMGQTSPAPQTASVTAAGSAAVTYSVAASTASGGNWLSVSPTAGTSPNSLSIAANVGTLATGTYTGSLSFTVTGASPLSVPVTLVVRHLLPFPP